MEFIIALTDHELFGWIAHAYIVDFGSHKSYMSIESKLSVYNIDRYEEGFTKEQMEIVKQIEEYSDQTLYKIFCKKKKKQSVIDFINSLKHDYAKEFIRPYIEKRILKVLDVLSTTNIKLFFRGKQKFINKDDIVKINKGYSDAVLNISKYDESTRYFLSITYNELDINLLDKAGYFIIENPCRLILGNELFYFEDINGKKLNPFFTKEFISVPKSSEQKWFETFALENIKKHPVKASGFEIINKDIEPKALLSLETDLQGQAIFNLKFQYDTKEYWYNKSPFIHVDLVTKDNSYAFEKTTRDRQFEDSIFQYLTDKGLKKSMADSMLLVDNMSEEERAYQLVDWLQNHNELLSLKGIDIVQESFDKKFSIEKSALEIGVTEEKDWFDISITVTVGEFRIPFIKFRKNIINEIKEYLLPNKEVFIIPDEWFTKYLDLLTYGKNEGSKLRLSKHHFELLGSTITGTDKQIEKFASLKELKESFELPSSINAELRNYQVQGYTWMKLLQQNSFGGCLADDMGLGKTIQTLALLSSLKENGKVERKVSKNKKVFTQLDLFAPEEETEVQEGSPVSIIAMPTSLIHNWENEIQKFTPNLSFAKYIGSNRANDITDFSDYDIILTTYGVIRNDIELLQNFEFTYLILDESQYIKNPDSKIYKAVTRMNATHKLVLTGTPIENSLTDLWSQLNFLNNGLLGHLAHFKREFVHPIEKLNDKMKEEKLLSLIKPFVLRRTKQEVAKELPDKMEQVIYCDMSPSQGSIYEEEKSNIRNHLMDSIEEKEKKPAFLVLKGLHKLRQIANHPVMIDPDTEADSGKFDAITRKIESVVAEKHKVLIFSSFVKHLNIIEKHLQENDYQFSRLTGSTRNKESVINEFTQNDDNHVFLIQIKAGGVGLNLTSADYVFILDPWWNPAVEEQAINRTHRIGQDKHVFIYRFISVGTVEEKIQLLKERKSELASTFINKNQALGKMSTEEMLELFS